uniref:Dextran-binding lectin B n=1 Tax=uncultured Planctomycetota bacterium TaxID=120965 RepID=H5SC98_9BACT|nr:dextran-binding lectin B [uncultured Planctomycetota bacterium]
MLANHFTLEASPAVIKYEDEPIYGGEAYVRVSYDPNLAGSLTFSATDLPPGISYDPTTGEFSGAALRSAVPRGGSPVTYNATITVSDGDETESATVPFTILDNTFSLETPATQVSHPGETVFFAPTLSYTQGNFSGPLMFSYENLPTSLSFDSLYGTVSGTIDANLVTPESNIRDYTVVLTVTDPITGDQQQVSFQWRVETDPYPAYISRVEQANAIYISAVQQALNERDSAWHTAIATVENLAEEAYAEYLQAANQAAQAYNTTVEQADAAYAAAVAQADAAYQEAESQASAQLHATLDQIWADYVQRVEADYQADLAAADAAYNAYLAHYQADRDQAYEYWQQHPDDPEAYAAYQQAQQDLDNAIAYANGVRDQAYAEAAARRDGRLADPYQDEQYATQEANAYAAYYSALDQAGAAWAAAEQAAYDAWQAAMTAAETAYTSAESQAWTRYLERLDELNYQLEHTRQILEGAFITAWNNALRDWTEMESEAWEIYQLACKGMLRPPMESPRSNIRELVGLEDIMPVVLAQRGAVQRILPRGKAETQPATTTGAPGQQFQIHLSQFKPGLTVTRVEIRGLNPGDINFNPVTINNNGQAVVNVTIGNKGLGPAIPLTDEAPDPFTGRARQGWKITVWATGETNGMAVFQTAYCSIVQRW